MPIDNIELLNKLVKKIEDTFKVDEWTYDLIPPDYKEKVFKKDGSIEILDHCIGVRNINSRTQKLWFTSTKESKILYKFIIKKIDDKRFEILTKDIEDSIENILKS